MGSDRRRTSERRGSSGKRTGLEKKKESSMHRRPEVRMARRRQGETEQYRDVEGSSVRERAKKDKLSGQQKGRVKGGGPNP